jgi:hypothetical protein
MAARFRLDKAIIDKDQEHAYVETGGTDIEFAQH